jgi:hypothetical protein
METRGPQPTQLVPKAHVANLEPGPPLSPTLRKSFVYTTPEECGGGGGDTLRAPQSTQSVPYAHITHIRSSEPGPPSKHSASDAKKPYLSQECSAPGLPVTEKVCSDGGGGEVAPRKS